MRVRVDYEPVPTCDITVLKTLQHPDLEEEYRHPEIRK